MIKTDLTDKKNLFLYLRSGNTSRRKRELEFDGVCPIPFHMPLLISTSKRKNYCNSKITNPMIMCQDINLIKMHERL